MARIKKLVLFAAILIGGFGLDWVTKYAAQKCLMHKPVLSFFRGSIQLAYAENSGAFLSLGAHWPNGLSFWIFSIIPLLFLAGITVYALLKLDTTNYLKLVAIAMVVSGGYGNILERIVHHRLVTDFMMFGIGSFRLTGVLNIADLFITFGCIVLILACSSKPANAANPAETKEDK